MVTVKAAGISILKSPGPGCRHSGSSGPPGPGRARWLRPGGGPAAGTEIKDNVRRMRSRYDHRDGRSGQTAERPTVFKFWWPPSTVTSGRRRRYRRGAGPGTVTADSLLDSTSGPTVPGGSRCCCPRSRPPLSVAACPGPGAGPAYPYLPVPVLRTAGVPVTFSLARESAPVARRDRRSQFGPQQGPSGQFRWLRSNLNDRSRE
jgi:hypothetical protein